MANASANAGAPVQADARQLAEARDRFTQGITSELAGDLIELPSFPEIALRVRKALGNPDIAVDDVVRMVSAEPSLAVRLLQLANSVALNPAGQRITLLRMAIARVGFNLACSATIAFAMSQMRRAEAWRGLEARFRELWEESAHLAAMSHAVAKRVRNVNADLAMLAGMLHAMGKLFVLTRISRFPELMSSPAHYAELERAWHPHVTRSILTRWEVNADVVAAASEFENAIQSRWGEGDLRDTLFAARYLCTLPGEDPNPDAGVFSTPPFKRLGLDPGTCGEVLAASATEIASLHAALID
ncbi:MAG TPA: HDOD domain-containing protein [Steroidobacteraceae bacterium]